ncbi:MAG: DUF4865 family protein [Syntrophobacteraceae bacterium]
MNVMQYEFTLPADYDMNIIRRRVATKGHGTDAFTGLGLKAYLIRERGVDGSPVNQYAPFYLWTSLHGMNSFLWGDGFRGVCASFGRPSVQHWIGLGFKRGAVRTSTPRAATRHIEIVSADSDPAAVIHRALGELQQRADSSEVHSAALAIDLLRWELVEFTLWEQSAPEMSGTRYKVLHMSTPHLAEILTGRHW